jgi:hypothetical protein
MRVNDYLVQSDEEHSSIFVHSLLNCSTRGDDEPDVEELTARYQQIRLTVVYECALARDESAPEILDAFMVAVQKMTRHGSQQSTCAAQS